MRKQQGELTNTNPLGNDVDVVDIKNSPVTE